MAEARRIGVSWRTTPEFKAKLDRAVAASKRSLMQEIELRLTQAIEGDYGLGGPRTAALLRTLAALVGDRDESWLEDPVLFNTITSRWAEHLDAIRPKLSPSDAAIVQQEHEEIRQGVLAGNPMYRAMARHLAKYGTALDPKMRAAYASLAEGEEGWPRDG